MSVSFQPNNDGSTMTLTPAGKAFIKAEEIKILTGQGDEFYKANQIHQMYLTYGVEEDGSYDKRGWREANAITSPPDNIAKGRPDKDFGRTSFMDMLHTLKWAAVGVSAVYIYQLLHSVYVRLR